MSTVFDYDLMTDALLGDGQESQRITIHEYVSADCTIISGGEY